MKMADVKVGMQLRSVTGRFEPIITVTEITERGFKYTHEPRTVKLGNPGGIPEFGTCVGGEHYGLDGEAIYEPFSPDDVN
jgi:hypothetical protein